MKNREESFLREKKQIRRNLDLFKRIKIETINFTRSFVKDWKVIVAIPTIDKKKSLKSLEQEYKKFESEKDLMVSIAEKEKNKKHYIEISSLTFKKNENITTFLKRAKRKTVETKS